MLHTCLIMASMFEIFFSYPLSNPHYILNIIIKLWRSSSNSLHEFKFPSMFSKLNNNYYSSFWILAWALARSIFKSLRTLLFISLLVCLSSSCLLLSASCSSINTRSISLFCFSIKSLMSILFVFSAKGYFFAKTSLTIAY